MHKAEELDVSEYNEPVLELELINNSMTSYITPPAHPIPGQCDVTVSPGGKMADTEMSCWV